MDCRRLLVVGLILISAVVRAQQDQDDDDDIDDMDPRGRNRPALCPKIRLRNGRVRIRAKGRMAKFACFPGYELLGKKFATCIRNRWNNPPPSCIARGCPVVPAPVSGRVFEQYKGALLLFDCNPGYVLNGSNMLECDGSNWNTTAPTCQPATLNPTVSCNFYHDMCGWSQDPEDDFDWLTHDFYTPSGHVGTGPAYDHTEGETGHGFYLYIEASAPRKENDTARLFSPVYGPSTGANGCFSFWYHMHGSTMGTLKVYLKEQSTPVQLMFTKSGDQGVQWRRGVLALPPITNNFQMIIEAIRGSGYLSDAAIDDVSILPMSACKEPPTTTDLPPISCQGRCGEENNSTCSCDVSCNLTSSCCHDYLELCTSEGSEVSTPESAFVSAVTETVNQTSASINSPDETTTTVITTSTGLLTNLPEISEGTTISDVTTTAVTTTMPVVITSQSVLSNTTLTSYVTTPTTTTLATSSSTTSSTTISSTILPETTTKIISPTSSTIASTLSTTLPTTSPTTTKTSTISSSTSTAALSSTTSAPTSSSTTVAPTSSTSTAAPITSTLAPTTPVTAPQTTNTPRIILTSTTTLKSTVKTTTRASTTTQRLTTRVTLPTKPFTTTRRVTTPTTKKSTTILTTIPTTTTRRYPQRITTKTSTTRRTTTARTTKLTSTVRKTSPSPNTTQITTTEIPITTTILTTTEIDMDNEILASFRKSGMQWQWWTAEPPHGLHHTDSESTSKAGIVGTCLAIVLAVSVAAIAALVMYRKWRFRQDLMSDDSDVRYLKDDEIRMDLNELSRLYDSESIS